MKIYYAISERVKSFADNTETIEEIVFISNSQYETDEEYENLTMGKISSAGHFFTNANHQFPIYKKLRISNDLSFGLSFIDNVEQLEFIKNYRKLNRQGKDIIKSLVNNLAYFWNKQN